MIAALLISGALIGGLLTVLPWWVILGGLLFFTAAMGVVFWWECRVPLPAEPPVEPERPDPWAGLPPKWKPPVESVELRRTA